MGHAPFETLEDMTLSKTGKFPDVTEFHSRKQFMDNKEMKTNFKKEQIK